ncbi:MAG TPA: hypothetical protein VNO30_02535 [Kofleriaceae bacterium]|nr:hypothetical protein [Kofleriaceae bacterium]
MPAVGPLEELPSREQFLKTLGTTDAKAAPLLRVLLAKCKPDAELADQLVLMEQVGRFVVAGPAVPGASGPSGLARLELLVLALERIPAARRRFFSTLEVVLKNTRAVKLFGEIGLPNDRGLIAETTDRLARRFLPEPPALHELWILAGHILRSLSDLEWLDSSADPLLHRLANLGGTAWDALRVSIHDSICLIATRIAALGMTEAFRTRAVAGEIRESALFRLARAQPVDMPPLILEARRHLDQVKAALESHGVSIEVVYALDSIERGLERIELLLPFVDAHDVLEPTHEIRTVIDALGRGLVGGRSFMQLMHDNLRLLARKVIERAGRTGEHYVTSGRREYWEMLASAAGGGFLTCGTAIAKFFVKWGHFALFIDGALSSVVYAGSFVLMQLLGFTLATKQPSMTAAALAGTIRDRSGPGRLDELVRLIARIARSQFAAAVGNVSAVIVTALAFDYVLKLMGHGPFLDASSSKAVIASFDPLGSGTIFFAALTGGLLWVSSLFAGWFENWVVFRRIPEALEHQSAGFGGSVALGTLLGMVPVFAKFVGLPLDVRHITLSSGSLTLAMSSIGMDGAGVHAFVLAAIGIAIIGLLNFGVSFALALVIALRARDVPRGERRTLPFAVLKHFLRRPNHFFFPPKEDPVDVTR